MDAKAWTIRKRRGGTLGPFTRAEIVQLIAEGELGTLDEVRFGDSGGFSRLSEVATFAVALRETKHAASSSTMPWLIGAAVLFLVVGVVSAWFLYRPSPEQQLDGWIKEQAAPELSWLLDDVVLARETNQFAMCARMASQQSDEASRFHALACRIAQVTLPPGCAETSTPLSLDAEPTTRPTLDLSRLDTVVRDALKQRPRSPWWWLMRALVSHAQNDHDVAAAAVGEVAALGGDTDAVEWTRSLVMASTNTPSPPGGAWLRASCMPHYSRHFAELLLTAIAAKPMWCNGGLCDLLVHASAEAGTLLPLAQARPLSAVPHSLLILLTPRLTVAMLRQIPEPRPTAVQAALDCAGGDCARIKATRPDRPWRATAPTPDTLPGVLAASEAREQALSAWRKGESVDAWVKTVTPQSAIEDRFFAALFTEGAQPWPEIEGPLVPFWKTVLSKETDDTLRLDALLERDDLYFTYNPSGLALYDAGLQEIARRVKPDNGGRFLIDLARVWLGETVTAPDVLAAAAAALRRDWRTAHIALEDVERDPFRADPSAVALLAYVLEQSGDDDALEWWKNLEEEASSNTVLFAALRAKAKNGERAEAFADALKLAQSGSALAHDSRLAALLWEFEP